MKMTDISTIDTIARGILKMSTDYQPQELRVYFHYMPADKIRTFLSAKWADCKYPEDAPHFQLVNACMARYATFQQGVPQNVSLR